MVFGRQKSRASVCTHIDFGGLGESPDRVNVVVENNDSHHHPHAEQHSVCVGEPTAVLPATETSKESLTRAFKQFYNERRTGRDRVRVTENITAVI